MTMSLKGKNLKWKYSLKDNNLKINSLGKCKIKFSNIDYLVVDKDKLNRNKYAYPKNLDILFEKK